MNNRKKIIISLFLVISICICLLVILFNEKNKNTIDETIGEIDEKKENDINNKEEKIDKDETIQMVEFDDDDYEKGFEEDLKEYYSSDNENTFKEDDTNSYQGPSEDKPIKEMTMTTDGAEHGELIFIIEDSNIVESVKDE